jgi:integrase/recombinase XerD
MHGCVPVPSSIPAPPAVPAFFAQAGMHGTRRFLEFFVATIRNVNTRRAYFHAATRFAHWCDSAGLSLTSLSPLHAAAYIELLGRSGMAAPSVKQHLAALRMLFDWLVIGHVVATNPMASVRGPSYVVRTGKTPVLTREEARHLLASIDPSTLIGCRDLALIGIMIYSFARVGAVVAMNIEDYWQQGKRSWLRLREKGGKHLDLPAHHKVEELIDAYLDRAGIAVEKGTPLFRSFSRQRTLTARRLDRREVHAMVRRRAQLAALGDRICCHSFRATGITVYLTNGGTIEKAQQIAGHESPRTTKLYDRTRDEVTLDEIERIAL